MAAIPPLGSTWIVSLECLGSVPGPRFLDGRTHDGSVGLAAVTAPPFTGTRWEMTTLAGGIVMLKSLGLIEGPNRFLDGRAQDGSAGLAPFITPPFSGTRWEPHELAIDEITLKCLGEVQGRSFWMDAQITEAWA